MFGFFKLGAILLLPALVIIEVKLKISRVEEFDSGSNIAKYKLNTKQTADNYSSFEEVEERSDSSQFTFSQRTGTGISGFSNSILVGPGGENGAPGRFSKFTGMPLQNDGLK